MIKNGVTVSKNGVRIHSLTTIICIIRITYLNPYGFIECTVWGSKIEPFYKNRRAQFRFPILAVHSKSGIPTSVHVIQVIGANKLHHFYKNFINLLYH